MMQATHPSAVPLIVGLLVLIAWFTLMFRKPGSPDAKRSKGWSAIGWALLFMTSGRMPPPPPESQIEQDLKARDNRSQSAGNDHDQ